MPFVKVTVAVEGTDPVEYKTVAVNTANIVYFEREEGVSMRTFLYFTDDTGLTCEEDFETVFRDTWLAEDQ